MYRSVRGSAYNPGMPAAPALRPADPRFARLAALSALLAATGAFAQAPVPLDADPATGQKPRVEQRVERIRVEDGGSRIDEVRYGGQTQSITVQPKANVPRYQITPTDGTRRSPGGRDGAETNHGQRVWNVLGF